MAETSAEATAPALLVVLVEPVTLVDPVVAVAESLATALLVEPVALVVPVIELVSAEDEAVPVLAKPLALLVGVEELFALVEGEDVAGVDMSDVSLLATALLVDPEDVVAPVMLELPVEVSLLATALLVEGVVLVEPVEAVSVLAKPVALPV